MNNNYMLPIDTNDYMEGLEEAFNTLNKFEDMDRDNKGKPEISHLGSIKDAIFGLCRVFSFGAEKYSRDNFKKGGSKNSMLDSMGRHYLELASGSDLDDESKLHHSLHLAWNALVFYQLLIEEKLR